MCHCCMMSSGSCQLVSLSNGRSSIGHNKICKGRTSKSKMPKLAWSSVTETTRKAQNTDLSHTKVFY